MTDSSSFSEASGAVADVAARIRSCRLCQAAPLGAPLPHEPRPVLRVSPTARLLVASQAPGIRVHQTGLPFNDPSGDRLRAWMAVDRATFYDPSRIAIVPMGFCFPGYDAHKGDLPPRRECRLRWHDELFAALPQIETILAIGFYAQSYHFTRLGLPLPKGATMTEIVRGWQRLPASGQRLIPLPHPSWRNSGWLKKNLWFEAELLPELRRIVKHHVSN